MEKLNKSNGMMTLIPLLSFVLLVVYIAPNTVTGAIDEDDGFRRLLRRASAEADRPLFRQQRGNKDDDDEEAFEVPHESAVRQKREEEDHFYHTLLKRAEKKRHEKRSFDTDDVDNKDALGLREDWTGDSKISDADKSELENLFSKLNTVEEEKKDVVRSADDESTVNQAAADYTSWLLGQSRSKLGGALSHKIDIDHSLTKLLFEDKRDVSQQEKRHIKKAKKTGFGMRKAEVATTNSTTPSNQTASLVKNDSSPATGPANNATAPAASNTTAPDVVNTQQNDTLPAEGAANQQDETAPMPDAIKADNVTVSLDNSGNATTDAANTTTACQKSCEPKLVAANANTTSHGPDVVARAWCQNACQPYNVATENPCKCNRDIAQDSVAKSFPPKAPALVAGYPNYAAAVPQQVVNPNTAYVVQQQPYAAAVSYQNQMAAPMYPYQTSTLQGVDSNPEVRTSVKSNDGVCERSCFPHTMLTQEPCLCSNKTGVNVEKEKPHKKTVTKKIYLDTPYYQGCFKDMRPLRDLPKRFTRYATTPETCVRECAYQNYKFAGVQYGYLCFCGNAFGRYGSLPDNDCNSDCQGDSLRKCGGYFHNSVYAVDGKEYDPSDFDFTKIDEEERKRDALVEAQQPPSYFDATNQAAYPGMTTLVNNYPAQQMVGHHEDPHENAQGANVATHLVKAAQAALTAAQKLLPSVAKKHKIATKGKKVKREDDEEDAAIMQEKLSALSSLGAVHDIMKKSVYITEKRDADRDKRAIDEDSDPFDPEDGKELLTAYMANVELYRRQTRSVDEAEEEDEGNEKPRVVYRRMTLGENDEGEFVEKYDEDNNKKEKEKKKKRDVYDFMTYKHAKSSKKRAAEKDVQLNSKVIPKNIVASVVKKQEKAISAPVRKRRSLSMEGSGAGSRKRRSLEEGSGMINKKRRSLEGSGAFLKAEKKKREVSMADLPEGAVKMTARSGDVNDIEASLRALEFLAKRDDVPKENDTDASNSEEEGENESGDSEDGDGSGSGGYEEEDAEIDKLFEKRSISEDDGREVSPKLRSDVDKGVDNLLNLVVELYKQQKTIRAFESSVRSLRDDIMSEINVPAHKKPYASKKVREEIEKTAKQRLHVLTHSIESKIKQFAKTHPEASKQVSLATTLLPQLPLSDAKYKIAKREISRRAAEFDDLEDLTSHFDHDASIPDILKEHFRRNSEDDVVDETNKNTVTGEQTLPRMQRNVQVPQMETGEEDYDVLFH